MKLGAAAVLVPVVVFISWWLSLVLALARAHEVTLAIKGYDPRDLLSGHYLRYTVDYGIKLDQIPRGPACLCLSTSGKVALGSWVGDCSQRDPNSCPIFLRGTNNWRGFEAGIERFYFPEILKSKLAQVPEGATISVKVTAQGRGYVTGMRANGASVLEDLDGAQQQRFSEVPGSLIR